jgi:hypothetical protein
MNSNKLSKYFSIIVLFLGGGYCIFLFFHYKIEKEAILENPCYKWGIIEKTQISSNYKIYYRFTHNGKTYSKTERIDLKYRFLPERILIAFSCSSPSSSRLILNGKDFRTYSVPDSILKGKGDVFQN